MLVIVSNTSRRSLPRSMSFIPGTRSPSWKISVDSDELPPGDISPLSFTLTNAELQGDLVEPVGDDLEGKGIDGRGGLIARDTVSRQHGSLPSDPQPDAAKCSSDVDSDPILNALAEPPT